MRFAVPVVLLAAGCAARAPRAMHSEISDVRPGTPVSHTPPPREVDRAAPDRKLIFHGSLLLQVGDPDVAEREVRSIVARAKGWIHKLEGAVLTLRVPADRFDETVAGLSKVGRVLDRKIAGTDVTDEYRDLELRLRNAEAVRARLATLLEKAKDVKEALEVERELGRVTEEIERLKGRLQAMADQVAYSTIVVALQRGPTASAIRGPQFPFPWVRRLGLDDLVRFHR